MTLRCPQCRTRRTTYAAMQDHIRASGHQLCQCGGYHYPHRPESTYCERNPSAPYWHAARAGATEAELDDMEMCIVWHTPGRPFTKWRD